MICSDMADDGDGAESGGGCGEDDVIVASGIPDFYDWD